MVVEVLHSMANEYCGNKNHVHPGLSASVYHRAKDGPESFGSQCGQLSKSLLICVEGCTFMYDDGDDPPFNFAFK